MSEFAELSALSRRDLLKLGSAAVAVATGLGGVELARPTPAEAQTPKRGGVFRIAAQLEPVHWDPHLTLSFATMTLLSFTHSRLMKVKAGSSVKGYTPNNGFDYGGRLMAAWLDR